MAAAGIFTLAVAANAGQPPPWWWFAVAFLGLAIGLVVILATFVVPQQEVPARASVDVQALNTHRQHMLDWATNLRPFVQGCNHIVLDAPAPAVAFCLHFPTEAAVLRAYSEAVSACDAYIQHILVVADEAARAWSDSENAGQRFGQETFRWAVLRAVSGDVNYVEDATSVDQLAADAWAVFGHTTIGMQAQLSPVLATEHEARQFQGRLLVALGRIEGWRELTVMRERESDRNAARLSAIRTLTDVQYVVSVHPIPECPTCP